MSIFVSGPKALALLRRVVIEADEKAWLEAEQFLKKLDEQNERLEEALEEQEHRRQQRRSVGRLNSGKFKTTPRIEGGVDHGSDGLVLARKGQKLLVWQFASKYWSSMMEPSKHAPPELELRNPPGAQRELPTKLTDNYRANCDGKPTERLCKKTILKYADKIDAEFGAGTAARVSKLEGTVEIPE